MSTSTHTLAAIIPPGRRVGHAGRGFTIFIVISRGKGRPIEARILPNDPARGFGASISSVKDKTFRHFEEFGFIQYLCTRDLRD